jgi:hypothetical protein
MGDEIMKHLLAGAAAVAFASMAAPASAIT